MLFFVFFIYFYKEFMGISVKTCQHYYRHSKYVMCRTKSVGLVLGERGEAVLTQK